MLDQKTPINEFWASFIAGENLDAFITIPFLISSYITYVPFVSRNFELCIQPFVFCMFVYDTFQR